MKKILILSIFTLLLSMFYSCETNNLKDNEDINTPKVTAIKLLPQNVALGSSLDASVLVAGVFDKKDVKSMQWIMGNQTVSDSLSATFQIPELSKIATFISTSEVNVLTKFGEVKVPVKFIIKLKDKTIEGKAFATIFNPEKSKLTSSELSVKSLTLAIDGSDVAQDVKNYEIYKIEQNNPKILKISLLAQYKTDTNEDFKETKDFKSDWFVSTDIDDKTITLPNLKKDGDSSLEITLVDKTGKLIKGTFQISVVIYNDNGLDFRTFYVSTNEKSTNDSDVTNDFDSADQTSVDQDVVNSTQDEITQDLDADNTTIVDTDNFSDTETTDSDAN